MKVKERFELRSVSNECRFVDEDKGKVWAQENEE
jgi:hypothetical protein